MIFLRLNLELRRLIRLCWLRRCIGLFLSAFDQFLNLFVLFELWVEDLQLVDPASHPLDFVLARLLYQIYTLHDVCNIVQSTFSNVEAFCGYV